MFCPYTIIHFYNVNFYYISPCVFCGLLSDDDDDDDKVLPDNLTTKDNASVVLLSCSLDTDTSGYVDSLIDASVRHSPHFDWIVAHIGYNYDYCGSCVNFVRLNRVTMRAGYLCTTIIFTVTFYCL